MIDRLARLPAWVPWVVGGAAFLAQMLAVVSALTTPAALDVLHLDVSEVGWVTAYLVLAAMGAVVAARRPEHPAGWLMLLAAGLNACSLSAEQYAIWGLVRHPGSLPGAAVAAWTTTFLWVPTMAALVTLAAYFPSGRLVSRRWRWLPVALWSSTAVIVAVALVDMWHRRGPRLVARKQDFGQHTASGLVLAVLWPVVMVCAVAALSSIVVRYRHSDGVERQQLKWLMMAAAVSAPLIGLGFLHSPHWLVVAVSLVNSPVWLAIAIGLAVLRYRIYDIDRIVSRTVSYAVLTAVLIGVYVGLIALIETVLGFSSAIAVATSTLAAAAAFQPLQRRVQRTIDRRFDRAAYDARRIAEAFATRLRDQVDVEMVRSDLLTTAAVTVAPGQISLWVAP